MLRVSLLAPWVAIGTACFGSPDDAQVTEWRELPRAQLAYYVQRGEPVIREHWGTAGHHYTVELHLTARPDGGFHGIALLDDYGTLDRERPLRVDFDVPGEGGAAS